MKWFSYNPIDYVIKKLYRKVIRIIFFEILK